MYKDIGSSMVYIIDTCVKMYACITYLDLITQDMICLMNMLSCVNAVLMLDDNDDILPTELIRMNLIQQQLHFMVFFSAQQFASCNN